MVCGVIVWYYGVVVVPYDMSHVPHCESLTTGYGARSSVWRCSACWFLVCVSSLLELLHLPSSGSIVISLYAFLRKQNKEEKHITWHDVHGVLGVNP